MVSLENIWSKLTRFIELRHKMLRHSSPIHSTMNVTMAGSHQNITSSLTKSILSVLRSAPLIQ